MKSHGFTLEGAACPFLMVTVGLHSSVNDASCITLTYMVPVIEGVTDLFGANRGPRPSADGLAVA